MLNPIAVHPGSPARGKIPLAILDAALLLALLLMPLVWFYAPFSMAWGPLDLSVDWGLAPVLAPLLLLAARLAWRQRLRRRSPEVRGPADSALYKRICLALLPAFFFLAALEWGAGLAGIEPLPSSPIIVATEENPDIHRIENETVKDPELLWKFKPGRREGGFSLNSHGFRTREFSAEKPDGLIRVISLGDSCTAQGRPPYSDRLHALLQEDAPTGHPWEAFNLGVYGYSVMQGHRQFAMYHDVFEPDIVTLYFGWNSHWLADQPDHESMAIRMNPIAARTVQALRAKRFYGGLARLVRRPEASRPAADNYSFRVSPEDYALTLKALIEDVETAGAIPIVITAPRRSLQNYLVSQGYARSIAEAENLHDQYAEATRSAARETGAELLDLARIFATPEHDSFFSKDGIHFTEEGLQQIAEAIDQKLHEMAETGKLASLKP